MAEDRGEEGVAEKEVEGPHSSSTRTWVFAAPMMTRRVRSPPTIELSVMAPAARSRSMTMRTRGCAMMT